MKANMSKYPYLFTIIYLLFFTIPYQTLGQAVKNYKREFILNGTIKYIPYQGKLLIGPIIEHPDLMELDNQSSPISQGTFTFSGRVADTIGVILYYQSDDEKHGLTTDIFFIESGELTIDLDYNSMRAAIPKVSGSAAQDYFIKEYGMIFSDNKNLVDKITDSMQELYNTFSGDTLRMELSKKRKQFPAARTIMNEEIYKKSEILKGNIVPFYLLYDRYDGESKKMNEWIQNYNRDVYPGNSIIFNALFEKIKRADLLSDSSSLPDFAFQYLYQPQKSTTISQLLENKHTLIEFWFAKCGSCIRQFNTFKDIYDKNSIFQASLKIVTVTIDKDDQINNAFQIAKKYPDDWIHLWDIDGKIARDLGVYSFPSNILLNHEGKIIRKNIEPYDLLNLINQ